MPRRRRALTRSRRAVAARRRVRAAAEELVAQAREGMDIPQMNMNEWLVHPISLLLGAGTEDGQSAPPPPRLLDEPPFRVIVRRKTTTTVTDDNADIVGTTRARNRHPRVDPGGDRAVARLGVNLDIVQVDIGAEAGEAHRGRA